MPLRLACQAMGTRFELVLAGQSEDQLRAVGELALEEIQIAHGRWNAFANDSVLSHLARCAGGPPVTLDPETFDLLQTCVLVAKQSRGFFNPLLGPLLHKLGLRDETKLDPAEDLGTLLDVTGLVLDPKGHSAQLTRPGMQLDLGAIAKGAALDLAARVLVDEGVTCALLHGGTSTALALDPPPGKDAWQVIIGPEKHAPRAHLAHSALSVSAANSRRGSLPRGDHSHILDPHRSRGTRHLEAAAVVAPSAATADAWSTALVAGCLPSDPPQGLGLLTQTTSDSWLLAPGRPSCFHIEPCTTTTPPLTAAPF